MLTLNILIQGSDWFWLLSVVWYVKNEGSALDDSQYLNQEQADFTNFMHEAI